MQAAAAVDSTGATRLLISPDGELNLVPFESLIDGEGRLI